MKNSVPRPVMAVLAAAFFVSPQAGAAAGPWIGPFVRPAAAAPVIQPNPASVFPCPMRGRPVHWEANHTFNPAAVVRDGKVYVLYRAEDDIGSAYAGYTSRLGLAWSDDGLHFTRHPTPVLFPDVDAEKDREWEGGCEDPRVVELDDGTYALFYTQYHRPRAGKDWMLASGGWSVTLGLATSPDLFHWTKQGPVVARTPSGGTFVPRKSASLVCRVRDGRLVAARINGRYWLYNGEGAISVMASPDLRRWETVGGEVLQKRPGLFDSGFPECGPPAVLTRRGIVVLYNAKNAGDATRDPALAPNIYSAGQALFAADDPTRLVDRANTPFFQPELPWEMKGQYEAGTTFVEGLVLFHHRWFLYYGSADNFVGVATAAAGPDDVD